MTLDNYEVAAIEALKARVRSADVSVSGSRRYRPFGNYLLPPADFEQLAKRQQTRLAVNSDAEAYLKAKQHEILQKLTSLQESIGTVEGSLILDEKGQLHLSQLEKTVLEVDNWTGFLRHNTPHQ